jgi:hypothetical protein
MANSSGNDSQLFGLRASESHSMSACILLVAASVAQMPPQGAFDVIRILNNSDQPWSCWMYVESKKAWNNPAFFLAKNAKTEIQLVSPGRFYLVLRDEAKRDQHLGWYDLHKLAQILPEDKTIDLVSVVVTEMPKESSFSAHPTNTAVADVSRGASHPEGNGQTQATRHSYGATQPQNHQGNSSGVRSNSGSPPAIRFPDAAGNTSPNRVGPKPRPIPNTVSRPALQVRVGGKLVAVNDYMQLPGSGLEPQSRPVTSVPTYFPPKTPVAPQ